MQKTFLIISTAIFFLFNLSNPAQQETESRVPALEDFHEVIYPIWHTAYPEKDYNALKSYKDKVNQYAQKIYEAKLPGILRDKKEKWDKGVDAFKMSVIEYNKQAEGNNNPALLKSAEDLHSRYEMLVRIIRPVLKEIDQFHKTLYVIYHTYLPEKNFDKIKAIAPGLVEKAKAIAGASLPARLKAKTDAFNKAAAELLTATENLQQKCKSSDNKEIEKAVDTMHTKYQKMEDLF